LLKNQPEGLFRNCHSHPFEWFDGTFLYEVVKDIVRDYEAMFPYKCRKKAEKFAITFSFNIEILTINAAQLSIFWLKAASTLALSCQNATSKSFKTLWLHFF